MFKINGWVIRNTQNLLNCGYSQDGDFLNIFYHKIGKDIFTINLKNGFRDYGIWTLVLYFDFDKDTPIWLRNRLLNQEVKLLTINKIQVKPNTERVEPYYEGYCYFCKKDFKDDGKYCSKECENLGKWKQENTCPVCRQHTGDIYDEQGNIISYAHIHHITYFPEVTIMVCAKCHNKIHKTNNYLHLRPSIDETKKFYNPEKIKKIIKEKNKDYDYLLFAKSLK